MITRKAPRLLSTTILPTLTTTPLQRTSARWAHIKASKPVPAPIPFVPDAPTFLTLIGRNMIAHSSKFPSWDSLFTQSSEQLRASGLEPARSRRYLLRWRQKYRDGEYGLGGDLQEVKDGAGELRVVEVKAADRTGVDLLTDKGTRRVVVNVVPGAEAEEVERVKREVEEGKRKPVGGVHIKSWSMIAGKNVRLLKGVGRAEIRVQEGLWEHRRGRKVDGGERRKAEVRAKRQAAERKDS